MSRGKAINVKVATTKVIKALETALAEKNKIYEADEKAQEVYQAELEKYNQELVEIASKHLDVAIWIMTICSLVDTLLSLLERFH